MSNNYTLAKDHYAQLGIDTDRALERLQHINISVHCWQGDDVQGFLDSNQLSGGIAVTGNHPGRATTPVQLRADMAQAFALIPGKHKVNLHAIYADTDQPVARNALTPQDFQPWIDWAKAQGLGLDFNPTLFAHPMAAHGFTLSSHDDKVRQFWIEHVIASRRIANHMGAELGQTAVNNIWIPDGYKDTPADRLTHRKYLKNSLDTILAEKLPHMVDAVESKLFGIGAESYTVGSHEFYMGYAVQNGTYLCLDSGHFHPTEKVSDKLSAVSLFTPGILLHVSRPVRWDSDHVVTLDDELEAIAKELVFGNLLERTAIGLDFFDASINRVAAWVIGVRNMQKALLKALLLPETALKAAERSGDYTTRLALAETLKVMPWGYVWDQFCQCNHVPLETQWLAQVKHYEQTILAERT